MKKNTALNFFLKNDFEEEEEDDCNGILEESPDHRWNKLDTEIKVQKLLDFDSAHLAIDTEIGNETAWNEMIYYKNLNTTNRFQDVYTLKNIYEKLKSILDFLIGIDHSNILKFFAHWFVENENEAKIVVITEYTTAGSLRKALELSKASQVKVKDQSAKRWINQICYSIKYLHSEMNLSIFQGNLVSDTIFIQNNGVIKLAPVLLLISDICQINSKNLIKPFINNNIQTNSNAKKLLKLTNDYIVKDIQAIGRISLEIFNSNFKKQPSPTKLRSNLSPQNSIELMFSVTTNDDYLLLNDSDNNNNNQFAHFINQCLHIDKLNPNIETIWFHPFINLIYSLKVLSVFSILTCFHDKSKKKTEIKNKQKKQSENNNNNNLAKMNNKLTKKNSGSEVNLTVTQTQLTPSSNNSSRSKMNKKNSFNSLDKFKDKRKVSLSFLSSFNNLTLPQNFFSILDDIRFGLYPRLFKLELSCDLTPPENSSLDNILQRKQFIDRRCSILDFNNYLFNKDSETNIFYNNEKNHEDIDWEMSSSKSTSTASLIETNHVILGKKKYETEPRRIEHGMCTIEKNANAKLIELKLNLKFNETSTRKLECSFPLNFLDYFQIDYCNLKHHLEIVSNNSDDENDSLLEFDILNKNSDGHTIENKIMNICNHLTNELIDYGLINRLDHNFISGMLYQTIIDSLGS